MKKYDFSLDGISVSVITLPYFMTERWAEEDKPRQDGYRIFLYPVGDADFGVTCVDENNVEIKEPYLPLTALSCFFKTVRHFPDITFEVLLCGKVYELNVSDSLNNFSVNVGKCKFLCAKTVDFADGVQIVADVVDNGITCILVVCEDSDTFSLDRLLRIPSLIGMNNKTQVIAVSSGGDIKIKAPLTIPYYSAVAASVSTLLRRGKAVPEGRLSLTVNQREHTVLRSGSNLKFYPRIKYLS